VFSPAARPATQINDQLAIGDRSAPRVVPGVSHAFAAFSFAACGFRQRPMVSVVPPFAPSGAPPPGQNTDANVSLEPQLTTPTAFALAAYSLCCADVSLRQPFDRLSARR